MKGLAFWLRSLAGWASAAFVLLLLAAPVTAEDRFQGVASCASSFCHGATQPLGQHPIRQDEYFIWQRRDHHAMAYRRLLNAESRNIASAMGISNAATEPSCLACHADPVALVMPDSKHQLTDGIGCESCHGGAERWLAEHTRPGITLAEKKQLGMTATWEPATRARVCLACHQGDTTHPISHAMMAAGHPRLVFELDTFTTLQPSHHDRDADYAERKGRYQPAQVWLTGQLAAAEMHLQALADGRIQNGLFTEWMHFDCAACHHPMDSKRWNAARSPGAVPGAVPFADAPQHLVGLWLQAAAPEQAAAWQAAQQQLYLAQAKGLVAVETAARQQLALLAQLRPQLLAAAPSASQLRALLHALATDSAHLNSPITGEQRAMALTVLSDDLRQQGQPVSAAARNAIDRYYKAVGSVDGFTPKAHAEALEALAKLLL